MTRGYHDSGDASCHPRLLLGLMIYGYATGILAAAWNGRHLRIAWPACDRWAGLGGGDPSRYSSALDFMGYLGPGAVPTIVCPSGWRQSKDTLDRFSTHNSYDIKCRSQSGA
jgi:hypothetical protein